MSEEFNNVIFEYDDYSYTMRTKFDSGTTVEMVFWVRETDRLSDTLYVEVGLKSYTKRRQMDRPDFEYSIRGKDGLRPAVWATNLLLKFPAFLLDEQLFRNKNQVVYTIFWSDSRRRTIYHKWLSRYGFYFHYDYDGQKCVSKSFQREPALIGSVK